MSTQDLDLTACDREPIHLPGAIQPHGLLLVLDAATWTVEHGAGPVEEALGRSDWLGADGRELLGLREAPAIEPKAKVRVSRISPLGAHRAFEASLYLADEKLIVELEPASAAVGIEFLVLLEGAAASFERAPDLERLCRAAARSFRQLTGYDRVMLYRFLEGGSGIVLGEDLAEGQHSFLNHHFPAADIPRQARALYVRNLVRVIPDVAYVPAPLRPPWRDEQPLDMSDCDLRSVSPIHVQYLKNMGVAASASISVVVDGKLWGLIACHNATPRSIEPDRRVACRTLASMLARQIKARDETDAYRERVRLRTYEDGIVDLLLREGALHETLSNHIKDLTQMLDSDGVAVVRGKEVVRGGNAPSDEEILRLARWAAERPHQPVFSTHHLAADYALPPDDQALAGGLLCMTLSAADGWAVLWFRAEEVQVVNWAGNPHKDADADAQAVLNPRSSFAAWRETIRGRSRRWTIPEIESGRRLRAAVLNVSQTRQIQELNRRLVTTVEQKDTLLKQNEFLLGEVSHRVQNSLQLVSSFLHLQSRESDDASLRASFEEARRRIAAVSLVHKRLYNTEQLESLDAGRYVDELLDDLVSSLGREWNDHIVRDLQPVVIPNDRAVGLGLVLTELIINANKYAYGGQPGPLRITLSEDDNRLRLVVEDEGKGRSTARKGFGTRMVNALVDRLDGTLEYEDARPGTRATIEAPIKPG